MANTSTRNSFLQRLIGAAALDAAIYEDVENDRAATAQALIVVLVSSIALGAGAQGSRVPRISTLATFSAVALVIWAAWALLTFELGARLMPGRRTHSNTGEVLRTTGFAAAPGLFAVFGLFPGVTASAMMVSVLWMLAAMVVAVRHALDYEHLSRAVAVCALGLVLATAMALLLGLTFGPAVA